MLEKVKQSVVAGCAKLKAVGMSFALGVSLALPAFATDGGGSGSGGDLATVIAATDTITQMVSKAWDMILSNPLTRVSAAAGLLSVGIGFFVYLRRAARH